MKKIILGLSLLLIVQISFAQNNQQKNYHEWWNDVTPGQLYKSASNKKLPYIQVKGNKFVDSLGNTILFRGVSISDPDKIEHQGYWNKDLFVKLKEFGVKLVRIPVHPVSWHERTKEGYLHLLDQAVE